MTILAYGVALAVLIVFHEFGHYAVARLMGVKVLRFSFGFGRVLFSRRLGKDGTEWAFSLVPLGGYVKMLDETEAPVALGERERAFNCQPVWSRMAIVAAGPLANLLLAWLLFWMLFMHGVPAMRPILAEPLANTPASIAGLHAGDEIVRMAGEPVQSWTDVNWILLRHAGSHVPLALHLSDGRDTHLIVSALRLDDEKQSPMRQLGLRLYNPPLPPVIGEVLPNSVAARAGLQVGDVIKELDTVPVKSWQDVVSAVHAHPGVRLSFVIQRGATQLTMQMVPATAGGQGKLVGRIGAGPEIDEHWLAGWMFTQRYSFFSAAELALQRCDEMVGLNLRIIKQLITGRLSWHTVSGPLTVASYAGESARMGVLSFVGFLAVVSIGLGVLNLLPIPLLDGGHLMYYAVEWLTGSPVSQRVVEWGQRVGLAALLALMLVAFYNDVTRLSGF